MTECYVFTNFDPKESMQVLVRHAEAALAKEASDADS